MPTEKKRIDQFTDNPFYLIIHNNKYVIDAGEKSMLKSPFFKPLFKLKISYNSILINDYYYHFYDISIKYNAIKINLRHIYFVSVNQRLFIQMKRHIIMLIFY